ncbi:MAG: C25 family peptidase propeptide domain-containing protein, partial [bacterium]|nr:C25 family peptidase propeptide domain-containing protein [bacterium]
MEKAKRNLILALTLWLAVVMKYSIAESRAQPVIVSQAAESGLTIEFTPSFEIEQKNVQGERYYKISFNGAHYQTPPRTPLIPRKTVVVAVPFGAKVRLMIVEKIAREPLAGKLLPTPEYGVDDMGQWFFRESSEIYDSESLFPAECFNVSDPKVLRDYQVVLIDLYPVQFDPQNQTIQLYERLKIRLEYSFDQTRSIPSQTKAINENYASILINPEQTANWSSPQITPSPPAKAYLQQEMLKIYIHEDGIYRITGSELQSAGMDLGAIDPSTVKIYNNGGYQLPESIYAARPESFIENAILVVDGGDGRFDTDDYILFYGQSVEGWQYNPLQQRFEHYLNSYNRENVYWLGWQQPSDGKRIASKTVPTAAATKINSFKNYLFIENELRNLLNSGRCWLGHYFSSAVNERIYLMDLKDVVAEQTASLRICLAGVSNHAHRFNLSFNDTPIGELPQFYGFSWQEISLNLKTFEMQFSGPFFDGMNRLKLTYTPQSDASLAYTDWIELAYQSYLKADNDELVFFSPDSSG